MGLCASSAAQEGVPEIATKDRVELLKSVPFFSDMSREHLEGLSKYFAVHDYNSGQVIVAEGTVVDALYVIAKGEVMLTVRESSNGSINAVTSSGRQVSSADPKMEVTQLCRKKTGDMFGELVLGPQGKGKRARSDMYGDLEGKAVRMTTVTTVGQCTFLVMDIERFRRARRTSAAEEWRAKLEFLGNNQMCEYLDNLPFLQGVSERRVRCLEDIFQLVTFKPGEDIVREGDVGDCFYVLSRGKVAVSQLSAQGEDVVLVELGPGAYFGEAALISHDMPRSATVRALDEPCLVMVLNAKHVKNFFALCPEAKSKLEEGQRMRTAQDLRKFNVPFFTGIEDRKLQLLTELCETCKFAAGATIFHQGEAGHGFYILVRGEVTVTRIEDKDEEKGGSGGGARGGAGEERVLATLTSGTYFGEMALLTDQPRAATCTAATQAVCLMFEKEAFHNMFSRNPEARADFELRVRRDKVELIHILRHKAGLAAFTKHMEKEFSLENIQFWRECVMFSMYHAQWWAENKGAVISRAQKLYDKYVGDSAQDQVNIKGNVRRGIEEALKTQHLEETTFDAAKDEIYALMAKDNFSRFKAGALFKKLLEDAQAYSADVADVDVAFARTRRFSKEDINKDRNVLRKGALGNAGRQESLGSEQDGTSQDSFMRKPGSSLEEKKSGR